MKIMRLTYVQILDVSCVCAFFQAFRRRYGDGKIISIHEDEVVEILGIEGELGEHGGWHTFGIVIGELASIVTCVLKAPLLVIPK
jgi:hypothetical protein